MASSDEILLGGLLHDVGKFMQRSHPRAHRFPEATERMRQLICPFNKRTGQFTHAHALWTQAFFDTVSLAWPKGIHGATVAALARSHHHPSSLEEKIIQQADWLSSGLDRPATDTESGLSRSLHMPLLSVFESLDTEAEHRPAFGHDLAPLGQDVSRAFPIPLAELDGDEGRDREKAYADLWTHFAKEMEQVNATTVPAFVSAISSLLMRFTWCIPASTRDLPDVSLYDHLKSTAAIAVCIHRSCCEQGGLSESAISDSKEQRYILLAGDLSGIQRYLFDIAEVGLGGTAKRLRARSFYMTMLAEIAVMKLLNAFDLTPVNLLMCSGGRFNILLPNFPGADERILELRTSFDAWLHRRLQAQIRINIAHVCASGSEFHSKRFSTLLGRLEQRLQEVKRKPLLTVLQNQGKWSDSAFVPGDVPEDKTYRPCAYCRKLPSAGDDDRGRPICEFCDADVALGRKLPRAKLVAVCDAEDDAGLKALGASFQVLTRDTGPSGSASWAIAINNPAAALQARAVPVWHRFLANFVPRAGDAGCDECSARERCDETEIPDPGDPLTFACLARFAQGRKALAYLKGDVDNLGRTMAFRFPEKLRSVSRLATTSRMLDLFFSGYVHQLTEGEFNDVYTVYSGGDDFLLIGPWDRVLELAQRLHEDFKRFTCGRLTFSAGFSLATPGTPIATAAPIVESCLERAKEESAFGSEIGRDQFHVFSTTIKWSGLPAALSEALSLAEWLDAQVVPISAIRRILVYTDMWKRYQDTADTMYLRFVPMLAYDLARNWPTSDDRDPAKQAARQWAARFRNVEEPAFRYIRLVLEYALNAHRRRESNAQSLP